MSPRKARLVADHIRGRSVPEARTVLAFTQRAAAREIEKVLRSAVANAEANHGLTGDELVVSAAYVDEGPVMKRWRARARGRVARVKKPTCHITVKLATIEGDVLPTRPAPPPPVVEPEPEEPAATEEPVATEEATATEEEPKAQAKQAKAKPPDKGDDDEKPKSPPPKRRTPRKKKETEE
jgi:large subunit ribosomal protein L22